VEGGGGEGHIYFERNTKARYMIYFGRQFTWLKYFTYRLMLVLAPNYKQYIVSPAKVRKLCYSLAELYAKSVYLNVFWWRGREVHETF
jgi:hypothetical protein